MGWLGFAKCDLDFATHERDIILRAALRTMHIHAAALLCMFALDCCKLLHVDAACYACAGAILSLSWY